MGDMAESWREYRQERQNKRAGNRMFATTVIQSLGIDFEEKNCGAHLILRHADRVWDFWPGTGKWGCRTGACGRGVHNLLQSLRVYGPLPNDGDAANGGER